MSLWNARAGGDDYAIWNDATDERFPPYAIGVYLRKGRLYKKDALYVPMPTSALLGEYTWCQAKLTEWRRKQANLDSSSSDNPDVQKEQRLLAQLQKPVQTRFDYAKAVLSWHYPRYPRESPPPHTTTLVSIGKVACIEDGRGHVSGQFIRRVKTHDTLVHVEAMPSKAVLKQHPQVPLKWLLTFSQGWLTAIHKKT